MLLPGAVQHGCHQSLPLCQNLEKGILQEIEETSLRLCRLQTGGRLKSEGNPRQGRRFQMLGHDSTFPTHRLCLSITAKRWPASELH